jgi:hypothetical protein
VAETSNPPAVTEPPPSAPFVPADWWDANFTARRKLLLDTADLTSSLEHFPILIKLNSNTLPSAELGENGADLRVADLAGNLLAHDIEVWDSGAESLVWVVLPTLPAPPAAAGFWLYYKPKAAAPPPEPESPWSAPFSGVWHLADMQDASANAYHGQRMAGGQWIPGAIGNGYLASVSTQEHIVLKNDIDVVGNETAATLSAWIKPTSIQGKGVIVTFGKAQTTEHASYLDLNAENGALVSHIDPMTEGGGYQTVASPQSQVKAGVWAWAVVVIDLTAQTASFYLDGKPLGPAIQAPFNAPRFSAQPSNRSAIGTEEDEMFNHYDGAVDEIRIERTARSAAWIAAQYRAMTDPAFVSWGAAELLAP